MFTADRSALHACGERKRVECASTARAAAALPRRTRSALRQPLNDVKAELGLDDVAQLVPL